VFAAMQAQSDSSHVRPALPLSSYRPSLTGPPGREDDPRVMGDRPVDAVPLDQAVADARRWVAASHGGCFLGWVIGATLAAAPAASLPGGD
jgi:hypothetical protein